jgi:hypothetical protein
MHRSLLPLPILLAGALFAAGCGDKVVSADSVAKTIKTEIAKQVDQAPKSVDCPDDLKAEVGATTTCKLVAADDSKFDVAVKVTSVKDDKALYSVEVVEPK